MALLPFEKKRRAMQAGFACYLILLAVLDAAARATEPQLLEIEKAVQRQIESGQTHSYGVRLATQDFALAVVAVKEFRARVIVRDPRGQEIRRFESDSSDRTLRIGFIAEGDGVHRLDVQPIEKEGRGLYGIALEQVAALDRRVEPVVLASKLESERIRGLREDIASGKPDALSRFWQEVRESGAPLVEKIADDPHSVLCTFLWRGDGRTKNVVVQALLEDPENDFSMQLIPGTDVWYTTVRTRTGARFEYRLGVNVPRFPATFRGTPFPSRVLGIGSADKLQEDFYRFALRADPLNGEKHLPPESIDEAHASPYDWISVATLPDAPAQPWVAKRQGVPVGRVQQFPMQSALLGNRRDVWVYTPPGYSASHEPYGLLLVFDGPEYLSLVPTPTIVDNLIADGRIPPLVVLLLGNAPYPARHLELTCKPHFSAFLKDELLVWLRSRYRVSSDPRRVIVAGSSYGGLASTCAAMHHPETFGNVISQSGSYWWIPPKDRNAPLNLYDPYVEPNHIAKMFIERPHLPVRFYMEAGTAEVDFSGDGSGILETNRHLRDVLLAKGYDVHYREFAGRHDFLSWRGGLADGLVLLGGN